MVPHTALESQSVTEIRGLGVVPHTEHHNLSQ